MQDSQGTYDHLTAWAESGKAPGGWGSHELRELVWQYLHSLDTIDCEYALTLGWTKVYDQARADAAGDVVAWDFTEAIELFDSRAAV